VSTSIDCNNKPICGSEKYTNIQMNAHAILLKEEGSNTFSSETITP
jgi:hypothetical protein